MDYAKLLLIHVLPALFENGNFKHALAEVILQVPIGDLPSEFIDGSLRNAKTLEGVTIGDLPEVFSNFRGNMISEMQLQLRDAVEAWATTRSTTTDN